MKYSLALALVPTLAVSGCMTDAADKPIAGTPYGGNAYGGNTYGGSTYGDSYDDNTYGTVCSNPLDAAGVRAAIKDLLAKPWRFKLSAITTNELSLVIPVRYRDRSCQWKRFYLGFSVLAKDPAAINDAAARGGSIDLEIDRPSAAAEFYGRFAKWEGDIAMTSQNAAALLEYAASEVDLTHASTVTLDEMARAFVPDPGATQAAISFCEDIYFRSLPFRTDLIVPGAATVSTEVELGVYFKPRDTAISPYAIVLDPGTGEVTVPVSGGSVGGSINLPITFSDSCKRLAIGGGDPPTCGGECTNRLSGSIGVVSGFVELEGTCQMKDEWIHTSFASFPNRTCTCTPACKPLPPQRGHDEWGRETVTFYGCRCGVNKMIHRETYGLVEAGDSRSWMYCTAGRQRVAFETFEYETTGSCDLIKHERDTTTMGLAVTFPSCSEWTEDAFKLGCEVLNHEETTTYDNNVVTSWSFKRQFLEGNRCRDNPSLSKSYHVVWQETWQ